MEQTLSRPVALIVDDEEGIRHFVQHVAESVGLNTVLASGGAEALQVLKTLTPAIVIMDMQMPNGDGVQLIQGLAGLGLKCTVVVLSGGDHRLLDVTNEIARQRGIEIGATLQKPVRFNDLRECLAAIYTRATPFSADALRAALEDRTPLLHYQPKIRLSDGAFIGVEALLRIRDGGGRPVPPDFALSIAEQAGLMPELNQRVFEDAVAQRRMWSEAGLELDVAVNLSASGSFDHELPARLSALCTAENVPPRSIVIEMTETALNADNLIAMETMVRLRLLDFRLSIDDFGTGHSSLVRLRRMPFSELKIDRSFAGGLGEGGENAVIVRSLANLARNLELHSVIEGVEEEAALRFATEVGCDEAQGYHIAKPMAPEEIKQFAQTWPWRQQAFFGGRAHQRAEGDAAEAHGTRREAEAG
ncbi:MAG TPA: EAL domain-containing response regulator [Dongiaceae bacterium]|jgi:EAL domain-containing protein (putative c-di-GMP-specific phosphodiesterase class I)/ActR/RegA family two-component response regulator|nr:EAL domain-containing response regulator [Dongiaceae bacterium]